ncbi:hypothetical protein Taro_021070, partial [Colocasia esculenta]|nr:hypothetical protein [Colocasia esculenta]
RYGTWRMQSDSCHVRWQRVRDPVHDRDCLPVHVCLQVCAGHSSDRDCLPVHARRPSDRDRLPADHPSSAIFIFFLTTGWRASIQQLRRGLSYRDDNHAGSQSKVHHLSVTVFVIHYKKKRE